MGWFLAIPFDALVFLDEHVPVASITSLMFAGEIDRELLVHL